MQRQVLNPRAALLSNYEVLHLLKQLEADHIARTRTAQRLKKEEDDAAGHPNHPLTISENLRTIEVEVSSPPLCDPPHSPLPQAIQYLSADYQPTRVQTAEGIQRLTSSLAPFGLTKAEKLQVVNLTPVEPVELYVVRLTLPCLPASSCLLDRRGAGRQTGQLHGRGPGNRPLLPYGATPCLVRPSTAPRDCRRDSRGRPR